MFQHQGAIFGEFIKNKRLYMQHAFQAQAVLVKVRATSTWNAWYV